MDRTTIIKDALAQVRTGRYTGVCQGEYLVDPVTEVRDGQPVVSAQTRDGCLGCALGALLVSAINGEAPPVSEVGVRHEDVYAFLKPYFEEDTLALIETAFEGEDIHADQGGEPLSTAAYNWAMDTFYLAYCNADERLLAILEYLYKHDGAFPAPG